MKLGEWLQINEKYEFFDNNTLINNTVHIKFELFTYPFIIAFLSEENQKRNKEFNLRILWFRANYKSNGFEIKSWSPFTQLAKYKVLGKWMFEWRKWY